MAKGEFDDAFNLALCEGYGISESVYRYLCAQNITKVELQTILYVQSDYVTAFVRDEPRKQCFTIADFDRIRRTLREMEAESSDE